LDSRIHRRQALAHLVAAAAAAVGVSAARPARADTFPSKPIQLILPFPPGGSFDPILRALCNAAGQDLGQPIVLMHKPGGGGVTGTASLATMNEADGYTIAVMHNSLAVSPAASCRPLFTRSSPNSSRLRLPSSTPRETSRRAAPGGNATRDASQVA